MNNPAMVARLNELDEQLCSAFGISRPGDATTLDEAITMSAATTERLLTHQRCVRDDTELGTYADSASGQTIRGWSAAETFVRTAREFADIVESCEKWAG